jgi:hypothetical protein
MPPQGLSLIRRARDGGESCPVEADDANIERATINRIFMGESGQPPVHGMNPAIQVASRCSDLALLVNLTARILDAVADRLLINIQPDAIADHLSW